MKKKPTEIFLIKKVHKLGDRGTIIKVKPGFSRNYLIPFKLGKKSTSETILQFEKEQEQVLLDEKTLLNEYFELKTLLEQLETFVIEKEIVDDTNQLFGTVNKLDILNLLEKKINFKKKIDKNQIQVPKIKEVGDYNVTVNLGKQIEAVIKIKVIGIER